MSIHTVLSNARTRLLSKGAFFGYLAMQMKPRAATPRDGVPTAGVGADGTLVVSEEYIMSLTPQEQAGVIAHEVLHLALFFFKRLQGRIPLLFNIAHDLCINEIIDEMSDPSEICLPKGTLLDKKQFGGMTAEQIYSRLVENGQTEVATVGGGSVTIDVQSCASSCNGNCQPGDGDGGEPCTCGCGSDDLKDKGYGDCREDLSESEIGKKAAKGDKAAQQQLDHEWKMNLSAAAQQHSMRDQGKLPGGLERFIKELLHPRLDWSEQLRRWTGEHGKREEYTFARPSRRSESLGAYLPSMCGGGHADLTIFVDTSGSIGQDRLKRAVSEISGVCEEHGAEIRVIVIDADVHEDVTIAEAVEVISKLTGGGGSDFTPAFDRLEEECYDGAVIAFTDGYISVPDQEPPSLKGTLWVTEGEHERAPTTLWGDHIVMTLEDGEIA